MPPDLRFVGKGVVRYDLVGWSVLPFEASPPGPLSTPWRGGKWRSGRIGLPDQALPLHEVERDRG
jgi:hypothetical protein